MFPTPGRTGRLFRNESGAFDLPSVLIGVAVVAILAVGVMALIFGAIPWAQNRAAAQDLAALTTAQGAAKAKDGAYVDPSRMSQLGYLSDDDALDYSVAADESCWVGVAKADSGKHFYTVNGSAPAELTRDTKPGCLERGVRYSSLSSGGNNTCGISSGTLYCWGYNGWGLTGNGTRTGSLTPSQVGGALSGRAVAAVYSSEYIRCAVDSKGQAYCWGNGAEGQLGSGAKNDSLVPVAVGGALTGKAVTGMSSALQTTCAVAEEKAYCWGAGVGTPHALGDATKSSESALPVLVDGGALNGIRVKTVSVGNYHVCALSVEGKAYCWGTNTHGGLGTGSTTSQSLPTAVNLSTVAGGAFTSLAVGERFTCAAGAGKTYCWGSGDDGRTGDDKSFANTLLPREVEALAGRTVTKVTAMVREACAIDEADGTWLCWGRNTYGQLGGPEGVPAAVHVVPSPTRTGSNVTDATLGMYAFCALEDSAAYCMGDNGVTKRVAGFTKIGQPADGGKTWVDTVLDGGKLQ